MKVDQREAIKLFLMVGAPITLILGSLLPSVLILPIALTLFFGTLMGAYIVGDIEPEQEKWKTKVIVFCSIVIIAAWIGFAIET